MDLIRHRALVSVVVAGALFFGAIAGMALYVRDRYLKAQAVLEEVEPRYARLLGLNVVDKALKKSVLDAYSQVLRWAYPPEQDVGRASNDVQQRIRRIADVAGMSVVSSQVLPTKLESGLEYIPVSLTMEGGVKGLQATLAAMASETPVLLVDSLSLRPIERGDPKQPQSLVATMVVTSMRVQP